MPPAQSQSQPRVCDGAELATEWAFQDELRSRPDPEVVTFSAPYSGYPFYSVRDTTRASPFATPMPPSHGLYRWHLPAPIYFEERLKVTVQQIGAWDHGLFERQDDISTTAYWYLSPSPAPPSRRCRRQPTADPADGPDRRESG
ncbi:DUF2961 domain-containing protein [Pseudonocardia cypriaca]|uniref:DUF2961 domain-containing protein n=1 Tax=Pseudonocardia cypriaca TaxID=882449 RepID=UPI00115147D8